MRDIDDSAMARSRIRCNRCGQRPSVATFLQCINEKVDIGVNAEIHSPWIDETESSGDKDRVNHVGVG